MLLISIFLSLSYSGALLWNSLPISAKEQGITINQFKSIFLVANAVSNPDLLLYIYILFSVFVLVKVLVCIIGF